MDFCCSRCRTSIGTRPPIVGDLVRAPRTNRENEPVDDPPRDSIAWVPILPAELLERLRPISSNTLIHIPIAFRDRLSRNMTNANASIASGDITGNMCARAWPKLLLSSPPAGFNLQNGLSKKFGLWRQGD